MFLKLSTSTAHCYTTDDIINSLQHHIQDNQKEEQSNRYSVTQERPEVLKYGWASSAVHCVLFGQCCCHHLLSSYRSKICNSQFCTLLYEGPELKCEATDTRIGVINEDSLWFLKEGSMS